MSKQLAAVWLLAKIVCGPAAAFAERLLHRFCAVHPHGAKFMCSAAFQLRNTYKPYPLQEHLFCGYDLLLSCNCSCSAAAGNPSEMCWKVTPALAAGDTVIIKVSKETTLTAKMMGDLILHASLPAVIVKQSYGTWMVIITGECYGRASCSG